MTWLPMSVEPPKDGSAILGMEDDETVAVIRYWDGQWWVVGAHAYYICPAFWRPVPQGPDGQRWGPIDKRPHLVVVPAEKTP